MISFDEDKHQYTNDKQESCISVTTLLKKYNLSPDYKGISEEVLKKAAQRGTAKHKMFEEYIKHNTVIDDPDLANFISYVKMHDIDLSLAKSELLVYDDVFKVAGTIDFIYSMDGHRYIADFKTTSSIHWNSVSWQLSIYNYLYCHGDVLAYYSSELQVIHVRDGKFEAYNVQLIDFDEVIKLLSANEHDEPYTFETDTTVLISQSEGKVFFELSDEIAQYETIIKELKEKRKAISNKLLTNMINCGIHKCTIEDLDVSIVHASSRKGLDTDKLDVFLQNQGHSLEEFQTSTEVSPRLNIRMHKNREV